MAAPQQIEQVRLPSALHMFSRAQHGQTQRHSIAGPTIKSLRKSRIFRFFARQRDQWERPFGDLKLNFWP